MTSTCTIRGDSAVALVLEEDNHQAASSSTADAPPILRLRLERIGNGPRVAWAEDVVDNEHLNKKKSKCCCIYTKPHKWNESSSENESETECDHCRGHVEKKKKKKPHGGDDENPSDDEHQHGHGCGCGKMKQLDGDSGEPANTPGTS